MLVLRNLKTVFISYGGYTAEYDDNGVVQR